MTHDKLEEMSGSEFFSYYNYVRDKEHGQVSIRVPLAQNELLRRMNDYERLKRLIKEWASVHNESEQCADMVRSYRSDEAEEIMNRVVIADEALKKEADR